MGIFEIFVRIFNGFNLRNGTFFLGSVKVSTRNRCGRSDFPLNYRHISVELISEQLGVLVATKWHCSRLFRQYCASLLLVVIPPVFHTHSSSSHGRAVGLLSSHIITLLAFTSERTLSRGQAKNVLFTRVTGTTVVGI